MHTSSLMKLHAAGVTHAKSLIASGAIDLASDWTPGEAGSGDALHYLALSEDAETKSSYQFVVDGKVSRAALKACARESQQPEITAAANELLKAVDDQTAQSALKRRPTSLRSRRVASDLRQWYRMAAEPASTGVEAVTADIYIYDDIGQYIDWDWSLEGVSAKQFINELRQLPASVTNIRVHINCRGGDPFEALAIANALRQDEAHVEILIEGLCASAATIVACAGDVIRMADNALYMVHQPSTCQCGNADDFRAAAVALDTITDVIIATYRWVSSLSAKALKALVDEETWLTADEALANGFVTDIVSGMQVAAALDRRVLSRVPDRFRDRVEAFVAPAPSVATAEEVVRLCREAGCLAIAESLIAAKLPIADVTARIAAAQTETTAAATRATDIAALCATARVPELAAGYIASAMPLEDVRTHLVTLQARMNGTEIDTGIQPNASALGAKNLLSPTAIYADRNKTGKKTT